VEVCFIVEGNRSTHLSYKVVLSRFLKQQE